MGEPVAQGRCHPGFVRSLERYVTSPRGPFVGIGFVGDRPNSPRAFGSSSQPRPLKSWERCGSGRVLFCRSSSLRTLKSLSKMALTSGDNGEPSDAVIPFPHLENAKPINAKSFQYTPSGKGLGLAPIRAAQVDTRLGPGRLPCARPCGRAQGAEMMPVVGALPAPTGKDPGWPRWRAASGNAEEEEEGTGRR